MILQSKHLTVLGLGITDNKDIVDGNHLRWFFDPALGFPKYCFTLYRRNHMEYGKQCFPEEQEIDRWKNEEGAHTSPWEIDGITFTSEREIHVIDDGIISPRNKSLTINLPETSNRVELSIRVPYPVYLKIAIYFAGEAIEKDVRNLSIGENQIIVSSDAIESIELTVRRILSMVPEPHVISPVILSKICWNAVSKCDYEWQKIAAFCLPVEHGDYPRSHGYSSDWEAAKARLDKNKEGRYDTRTFETGLKPYLEELVKSTPIPQSERVKDEKYHLSIKDMAGGLEADLNERNIPERLKQEFELNGIFFSENATITKEDGKWTITDNSKEYVVKKIGNELHADAKVIQLQPMQMVLLSSLDPGVAQMLGLYYINLPVEEDVATGVEKDRAYDYKVVGCWTKIGCWGMYENDNEKLRDMYPVDFSSIQFDESPISFQERGFDFRSGNTISADKINGGYFITINGYLTIDFPRPMSMLNIGISLIGPVNLKIQKGDGSIVHDMLAVAGSKIFEDHNSGIVSIEIIGHFHLYEFSYAEMNYAWITSNIKMKEREAIDKPYGLKTYLLPGKSVVKKEYSSERVIYAPATVGFKWNLASAKVTGEISGTVHSIDVVNEDTHVLYLIERQQLGESKDPEPINNAAFEIINKEKPVLVPRLPEVADGTRIEPEFPPEWPLQTKKEKVSGIMSLFYIDAGYTDDKGLLKKPLVKDTWYAYQVIGIDMFGRHSEPSSPAQWYNSDGRREHRFAIHLKDRFPPPPPLAISAKFLDPKDPYLQKNEKKWVAGERENRKGFRVIWKWPENLQIQAPDAEKFRIYFKPGLLNVLEGKVKEVTCFDESENMGLHLKGEIVRVNEADNEISMEIKAGEEIEIDTDPSNRYFKYDRNFFDITEISRSDYDAETEIQTIDFTIEREVELQRHKTAILEIPKEGINLRGNIRQVRDNNRITIRIPSDIEVKIPLESEKEKFIKYGNKRFKVTDVIASIWNRRNKYLTAVLIVGNPMEVEHTTEEKTVTGVFDVDNSEVEVHFDEVVDIEENSFARRILRQRGKNFVIIKNTASESILDSSENPVTKVVFTVQNLTLPPREIPEINKSASLLIDSANPIFINYGKSEHWGADGWDGMVLEVDKGDRELFDEYIPEDVILKKRHRLRPTPQEPMTSGNVGIATVDDSENESSVSPPQPVFAVLRDKPKRPSMPDISELWATIPDYYGRSHFDVKWPVNVNDEKAKAYFYQAYRTMDKTLMLVDIEEHTQGHRDIDMDLINDIWGAGNERQYDIQPDLDTLAEKISACRVAPDDKKQKKLKELIETYTALRNDTKQYLASLPENEKAFVPVSSPLDPIKPENWEESNMFFKDPIEGKGRNRYFYRIGAMDKAGNRSYLGLATPPVCVPDVIPPKPPVITKALGGNRKAIIRWRRNTEPEMVRYEIYRTDKKEDAADVRLMGEPVVIDADAEGTPIRALVIKSNRNGETVLSGYLDVSFVPNASSINEVYEVNEGGERVSEENHFDGFKSLTLKVSIDEGDVDVQYSDTEGDIVTKNGKAFKGQLKVNTINGEKYITTIMGVYRECDTRHSDSIFAGISSGKIVLQAEEVSSLKGKRMAVSYTDREGTSKIAQRIPYELEYIDDDLEAGAYYYRIVAVRDGVIGEGEDGTEKTIELSSYPSKPISVRVFDSSPPEPPEWGRVEWVKLDEEGIDHSWDEEVENYMPAVVLDWNVRQPGIKCILQRRVEDREYWTSVSQWLSSEEDNEADERWSWVFFDKTVREDNDYRYRIKLVNTSGKTTLSEEISPENRR